VKSWDIPSLDLKARLPEILSSTPEARVIALDLRAGEGLPEHEVHERAWIVVIAGEVEISSATGERVSGTSGLLVEVSAAERHEVVARSDARLLLLLTPWPGSGHPGAMTMRQKLYARRRAAKRRAVGSG
jgi:redox-sensitive bicupin YhaK (pirin superfamily)